MFISPAKVRIGPAGLHYSNRSSGLNVLIDEVQSPESRWHTVPRHISIALTNACDLGCPYCYAPKVHAILNYHSVCRWLREFDQHGVLGVGFGGGEPTLHPRFADFCKFTTRETSLAVTFTTHGHHLQPKLLGQLEGQVNFIRMSMDGVGRTYERLRRKSFVAFTERVREVRSIAPVGINFVVNADTVEDLDEAIAFAHAEGVREFLLLPELPVGPRRGVGISEISQLQAWVRAYRGTVRLAVSEAGAEGMGTCDPCSEEIGLRSFAHITAAGRLQRSSFVDTGVPIAAGGVMAALKTLKHHPLPT